MIEPYGKDLTEPLMEYIRLNGDKILAADNRRLEEENKMLKKQVADDELYNKLCEIDNRCGSDSEARHVEADELLTECLRTLGFNKSMDKYDKMEFRYA